MRRLFVVLALAPLVACGPRDLAAEAEAQIEACDTEVGWPARIAACTAVIRTEGASNDQRATAFLNRGAARSLMVQQTRAVADFGRALRLNPELAAAYFERGLVHHNRGAFDQAIADYDRALRLEPNMQAAIERREVALNGQVDDFTTRVAQATQLIEDNPTNAALHNNRCWIRAVEGAELDEALTDCNESLRLAPNDAQTLDSRGLVYLKRGEYAAALADYEAAVALEPQQAHFVYGRGVTRLNLGQADEGAADLRAALALEPDIGEIFEGYGVTPPSGSGKLPPKP